MDGMLLNKKLFIKTIEAKVDEVLPSSEGINLIIKSELQNKDNDTSKVEMTIKLSKLSMKTILR